MPQNDGESASSHGTPRLTKLQRTSQGGIWDLCKRPAELAPVLVFCRSCDQLRARVVSGWHLDKQSTNFKGKIAARGDHSVDALPRKQKEQNLLSFVSNRSLSTVLQHSCSPRACDLRAVWRGETRMGARIAGRTHSNHAFTSAAAPRGRADAVAARTRPTQTTQIIASSASRCRAFANRAALRRQK